MEKIDRLWPGGYRFLFDDALFQPTTDTFLLGDFVRLRRGDRVCDLGAGTGLLGLLLLARQVELTVTDVEIQPSACALARRTAELNGLEDRITVMQADLRLRDALPHGVFDAVVSNPPFFAPGTGAVSGDAARSVARSEVLCTLDDVCAAAARLLTFGGRFSLVFRPDRLAELLATLQSRRLEPKRLRFVHHTVSAAPSLLLLESRLGGKPGLTVEPPLVMKDEQGNDSAELRRAYFQDR